MIGKDREEADLFGLRGRRGGLLPAGMILFFRAIGPDRLCYHLDLSLFFFLCLLSPSPFALSLQPLVTPICQSLASAHLVFPSALEWIYSLSRLGKSYPSN